MKREGEGEGGGEVRTLQLRTAAHRALLNEQTDRMGRGRAGETTETECVNRIWIDEIFRHSE